MPTKTFGAARRLYTVAKQIKDLQLQSVLPSETFFNRKHYSLGATRYMQKSKQREAFKVLLTQTAVPNLSRDENHFR